jgi:hypothetical protein
MTHEMNCRETMRAILYPSPQLLGSLFPVNIDNHKKVGLLNDYDEKFKSAVK